MSPSPSNPRRSSPPKSKENSVQKAKGPTPSIPQKPSGERRKRLTADACDGAVPSAAPWTVPALRAAYLWPSDIAGGVIAIVELGDVQAQSDDDSFFQSIKEPSLQIADVSVDGTQNSPDQSAGSQENRGFEIALQIEIAGSAYLPSHGPTGGN
jgi:hypothetical protein